jgi:hypothetical protein
LVIGLEREEKKGGTLKEKKERRRRKRRYLLKRIAQLMSQKLQFHGQS